MSKIYQEQQEQDQQYYEQQDGYDYSNQQQQQDFGGDFANELMMDNQNYDENLMDGDPGMLNDYNDEDMLINDDNVMGHDMQDMVQEGDDNYFFNQ